MKEQISDEGGGLRYKICTSDLNVVWRLYEVRASDGTIGYKTRSVTILSRVDEQMDVEQSDRQHAFVHHDTSMRLEGDNQSYVNVTDPRRRTSVFPTAESAPGFGGA